MPDVYITKAEIEKAKKIFFPTGLSPGDKVAAIKYIRGLLKVGLKAAKDFVESGYTIPFVSGSTRFNLETTSVSMLTLGECFEEMFSLMDRLVEVKKRIEELSSQGG